MAIDAPADPLEVLRDPATIRARLATVTREAEALRRLLKIAESARLREPQAVNQSGRPEAKP